MGNSDYITSKFKCADGYLACSDHDLTVLRVSGWTPFQKRSDYLNMLRKRFTKLCRLRFLNPDGSTAFSVDANRNNPLSRTFISSGSLSVNLQNGNRRSASVTLSNVDGRFDFAFNRLWFGQEIALDEGMILSNGEEYYIQQGVFLIKDPSFKIEPSEKTAELPLVDKWSYLDGSLGGNLEGTYQVKADTNVFDPITALLAQDRGNRLPIDALSPVYTEYYNGKTQTLPDGTSVPLTQTPYTLTVDSENGAISDVILGLTTMLNAWVGYDPTGRLRVDPSQDDILDTTKPVLWTFSQEETTLLGLAYASKNTAVYNDYIVIGEQLENYAQPAGRAQNLDPASPTNVGLIGRKTIREHKSGYVTETQCTDYAQWKLKRAAVLQNAVTIECTQILHIEENCLVTVTRTDRPGNPREQHLVTGFTRPLASTGAMQITATSVNDFPNATLTGWPG